MNVVKTLMDVIKTATMLWVHLHVAVTLVIISVLMESPVKVCACVCVCVCAFVERCLREKLSQKLNTSETGEVPFQIHFSLWNDSEFNCSNYVVRTSTD